MLKWKRILILSLVVSIALAFSVTGTAFADDGPPRHPEGRRLAAAAHLLDMSVEELRTALESGLTLREIAEQQGITFEDLRPRLYNRLEQSADVLGLSVEELRTALESGLTLREIAEQQGITLEDLRPRLYNRLEQTADALGLSVEELRTALASGLTLREIAEQQGITREDVLMQD